MPGIICIDETRSLRTWRNRGLASENCIEAGMAVTGPILTSLPFFPQHRELGSLRHAARDCRGCALFREAAQTVFGKDSARAVVLFVGEQPGDQEDRAGEPFVGPPGKLLDAYMEGAGIDRSAAYVTNAVEHFKWKLCGKRRLHNKPRLQEVSA